MLALSLSLPMGAAAATVRKAPGTDTEIVHSRAPKSLPPARIKSTLRDYARWLNKVKASGQVSGLATAVVAHDKVVFESTLGYADAADDAPVRPTTVFRLASLSKAFATAITGLLVRDGMMSWDTRVADVLPFFRLKDADGAQQATVRDILSHRLGLPHNTFDLQLEDDVPYQELVRKLDQVDMTCGVGDCYSYQNIAFSLIGDIVYAESGDFFYHQVEKRLFAPLRMNNATYGRDALEASKSWARPHRRAGAGWVPFEPNRDYYRIPPAAGVNASLRDMEKWLIAQMGGRPDVLPSNLLEVLHEPIVETPDQLRYSPWRRGRLKDARYALGWRIYDYAGHRLVFHAGAVQGYRTMIGFLPEYGVGMVMLWNCGCVLPAGLMPMVLDDLLALPQRDWADLDKLKSHH